MFVISDLLCLWMRKALISMSSLHNTDVYGSVDSHSFWVETESRVSCFYACVQGNDKPYIIGHIAQNAHSLYWQVKVCNKIEQTSMSHLTNTHIIFLDNQKQKIYKNEFLQATGIFSDYAIADGTAEERNVYSAHRVCCRWVPEYILFWQPTIKTKCRQNHPCITHPLNNVPCCLEKLWRLFSLRYSKCL